MLFEILVEFGKLIIIGYSWIGYCKLLVFVEKVVFFEEFLIVLRIVFMEEDEVYYVVVMLEEVSF